MTIPSRMILAAGTALLVGCASNEVVPLNEPRMITESDPALVQLVSIAQNLHARTAINDQIMTKRYGIEDEAQLPIKDMPANMRRIVGYPGGQQFELERIIKNLCIEGGLSYINPQGRKPISGIFVFFDGQLRTVGEFIADAGRQAGFRADVVLDLTSKPAPTVQIQYKELVL
ncbi:hypothetical protein [uncultured Amphritea sp.]|uniref:hypothetical protein n=1 Tax=uncultured Amphritea sp. TaxID=981605 RepID=UPI00261A9876|nr:hypothetical protein [uncultured Amphritea sp.]